jgi:hypothetical protein
MNYRHKETGSVGDYFFWTTSYSPEELDNRGLSASEAFEEDVGKTLFQIDNSQTQEAKAFVSSRLSRMCKRYFEHIELPLRVALFQCISDEDWENKIIPEIRKQYPELNF